ncbi:MAG: nitroreductase family protein [Clostridiales bacterium]|nr:nitroreductase family protein [Clostridiales bacterium]
MKKRMIVSVLVAVALIGCFTAAAETTAETAATGTEAAESEAFAQYLTEVKTNQYFEDTPVPEEDTRTILEAGINAQSGMNMQNWHFTAVTSHEVLQQIADDMSAGMPAGVMGGTAKAGIADAPLVILISCGDGKEYDAGLATQAMNSAALALGYGTKIISSPSMVLNGEKQAEYKEQLGIPDEMAFVGAILIGEATDTSTLDADAITGPTVRNDFSEMTTFVN